MSPVLSSLLVTSVVSLAATIANLCISVGEVTGTVSLSITAAIFTLLACLPPLWFSRAFANGAVTQMAVPVWRFGILLPAIAWSMQLTAAARNYFCIGLLACYFAALPLESWLLARQVKHS